MISHEKARILGRMFRGGYDGEGTDLGGGFGDGPGFGWGGTSNAGVKPGEDAIAHAGAHQVGNISHGDFNGMTGFNSENPTQSVAELMNAETVNKALSFGLPMAMSMAVPGFGLVNTTMKAAANLKAGMNPMEAVGGLISTGKRRSTFTTATR